MSQRKTGEIAPWAREEMATAQLEDKRLNRRLSKILSDLGDRPAAYRSFDNPKVTSAKMLEPHLATTRRRMAAQPVVLLVQDTTEVQMTRPQQQVVGAGPLDGGTRRGAFLHPLEAFTPDGTPRGAVSMDIRTRPQQTRQRSRQEKDRQRRRLSLTIEQKESFRWLQGLRTARQIAQELPQIQIVFLADFQPIARRISTSCSPSPAQSPSGGRGGRVQDSRAGLGRAGVVHATVHRSGAGEPKETQ